MAEISVEVDRHPLSLPWRRRRSAWTSRRRITLVVAAVAIGVLLATPAFGIGERLVRLVYPSDGNIRTFDLRAGLVNGRPLLGQTVAEVTAALGSPDSRHPGRRYRVEYDDGGTIVYFSNIRGQRRAISFAFLDPAYSEARLGKALRLKPPALERAIRNVYGDFFVLERPYVCRRDFCIGVFAARAGGLHINFGRVKQRTFIVLWQT
jgi:hypothetical protein